MPKIIYRSFEHRQAVKQAARDAADLAIREGRKTPEQVRLESEVFAFGPDRARHVYVPIDLDRSAVACDRGGPSR